MKVKREQKVVRVAEVRLKKQTGQEDEKRDHKTGSDEEATPQPKIFFRLSKILFSALESSLLKYIIISCTQSAFKVLYRPQQKCE